ncbi:MAG: hypothetical protein ACRERC_05130 [Candidatus Binatia bacterium]
MPSIDLGYEAYIVRAMSADASDLSWLASVLECGFDPVEGGTPHSEVTLTIDAVAHDALLAGGRSETAAEVETFAQDTGGYLCQPWSAGADALVIRDPQLPGFYRLSPARRAVEILARTHTLACRHALMRVVRELAMDRIVATGGVLVHGAAFHTDGGAVVVSGLKRRGKTSLLLALLQHTGVAYISNDRCVLRVDGAAASVRGLPTLVSITRSGLDAAPRFRQRLFALRPDLAARDAASVGFGPDLFARVLDSPRAAAGPLAACLFPRVTANPERLVLHRLSIAEALAQLREGLFRATRATLLADVFSSATARGRSPWELGEATAHWLAANCPCFLVELGGGAPPTAEECRALLAHVAAGGSAAGRP